MTKPQEPVWCPSSAQWAEALDKHGSHFLEAETNRRRQEAATMLLRAVSSMLRYDALGTPTPEAGKAISHIVAAFNALIEGEQPELLKAKRPQGRQRELPRRKRLKSIAAAWVAALVHFGEKQDSAASIVAEALNAIGVRGYKDAAVVGRSVEGWKLDELAEKHLPDIEAFLAFRTSGWRPELDENERSKLVLISDDEGNERLEFLHLTKHFSFKDLKIRRDLVHIVTESLEPYAVNKKPNV